MKRSFPSPSKSISSPARSPARKISLKSYDIAWLKVDPRHCQDQSRSPDSKALQHEAEELVIDEAIAYVDSLDINSCCDCNDREEGSTFNFSFLDDHYSV